MNQESPITDIKRRMLSANVSHAFLIETWNGRNRKLLQDLIAQGDVEDFSIVLCYDHARTRELCRLIDERKLHAVRMSTSDLDRDRDFCREISRSGTLLVVHAEAGIGPLANAMRRLSDAVPGIRFYIPHLAWPVRNGKGDPAWRQALKEMTEFPSLLVAVSAIAHFSSQPFPHADVHVLALHFLSQFPPFRIIIGSDYPLFEKQRYADYIQLAENWLTSVYPAWVDSTSISNFMLERASR